MRAAARWLLTAFAVGSFLRALWHRQRETERLLEEAWSRHNTELKEWTADTNRAIEGRLRRVENGAYADDAAPYPPPYGGSDD